MQRNILHQKRDQTQTALGVLGAFSCITKLIHDYARANSGGTYDIRSTQVCLTFSWIFDVEKGIEATWHRYGKKVETCTSRE